MLIYIIEDSPLKSKSLETYFAVNLPHFQVITFGSYNTGLSAIITKVPDLIILDMSMSSFDKVAGGREGKNRPLGGYSIMRKLKLHNIKFSAIVVSQLESFSEGNRQCSLEEIEARCTTEFFGEYLGWVKYTEGGDWGSRLSECMYSFGVARD